jgi:hypothetical protein
MILIFSDFADYNTNQLIDWLRYYNCKFKRINLQEENSNNLELIINNEAISLILKLANGDVINLSESKYIYSRGIGFKEPITNKPKDLPSNIFDVYINQEFSSLTNYFYRLSNKKSIGCFVGQEHSKLIQLETAKNVGLSIGNSIILNNKEKLIDYYKNKKLITKAIYENIGIQYDNRIWVQRVQKINQKNIPDNFFSSLFQLEIEKEYEIRIFFLDKTCYSIAFNSKSSNIDMRDNYDISHYEPYILPIQIENKIIEFM